MTESLVDRVIRRQTWLEKVADALQGGVGAVYGALGRPGRAVESGRVFQGPATFDQPTFVVREREGHVELKLATPRQ